MTGGPWIDILDVCGQKNTYYLVCHVCPYVGNLKSENQKNELCDGPCPQKIHNIWYIWMCVHLWIKSYQNPGLKPKRMIRPQFCFSIWQNNQNKCSSKFNQKKYREEKKSKQYFRHFWDFDIFDTFRHFLDFWDFHYFLHFDIFTFSDQKKKTKRIICTYLQYCKNCNLKYMDV